MATFSDQLVPCIEGYDDGKEIDSCWTFCKKIGELSGLNVCYNLKTFLYLETDETNHMSKNLNSVGVSSERPSDLDETVPLANEDSIVDDESKHEQEVRAENSVEPSSGSTSTQTPALNANPVLRQTQHSNPSWLEELNKNIHAVIIEECSSLTKRAVANNEPLNNRDHKTVKEEILNKIMMHLKNIFQLHNLPSTDDMTAIAFKLSHVYPRMFCYEEDAPIDCKKAEKVKVLGSKMRERLRGQLRKDGAKRELDVDKGESVANKKGKKLTVYGVISWKWLKEVKVGPDAINAFSQLNSESSFEKREEVFNKYREELTASFRKAKKSIPIVNKPFFKDPRHLALQWQYLTETEPLFERIEANYKIQFANIEKFLRDQITTSDFCGKMASIEEVCQLEHNGSTLWKDINLLVCDDFLHDCIIVCMIFLLTEVLFGTF